jgi:hypothetical protein
LGLQGEFVVPNVDVDVDIVLKPMLVVRKSTGTPAIGTRREAMVIH